MRCFYAWPPTVPSQTDPLPKRPWIVASLALRPFLRSCFLSFKRTLCSAENCSVVIFPLPQDSNAFRYCWKVVRNCLKGFAGFRGVRSGRRPNSPCRPMSPASRSLCRLD
jgi:hypothetical protein